MLQRILTAMTLVVLAVGPALLVGCAQDEVKMEKKTTVENVPLTEPTPVVD
ncbi:MAG: hypothetical protein ACOCWV_05300 [Planctomycetota bacterium]